MENITYVHRQLNNDLYFLLVINVDYELYINDESKASSASLATPFHLGMAPSFTVAMWVQFATSDDLGTFFTLYSVS